MLCSRTKNNTERLLEYLSLDKAGPRELNLQRQCVSIYPNVCWQIYLFNQFITTETSS